MMILNALLVTPVGNILLIALALTIATAAAIVARSKIKRASLRQNKNGSSDSHATREIAGG